MSKYVKVIDGDSNIVDVLDNLRFVKWNTRSNMVDNCTDSDPNVMGLLSSDASTIWHLEGKTEFPTERGYVTVTYEEIDKDTYDLLKKSLDESSGKVEDSETQTQPEVYDSTVELVKQGKIAEMSTVCENTIVNGIDVVLSDGESHHFSLSVQDQLNLITLSAMVAEGQESIPYHADGELCVFYSAQDMLTIINTATTFKTYQVSYFNALKAYIEALDGIETISAVTYGMDIPEDYQSEVLKALNSQVGDDADEESS